MPNAKHQIVVLEDDARRIAQMRELIQIRLGMNVRFFDDPQAICEWLDMADQVDLISLDCDLPGSTASELGTNDGVFVANHVAQSAIHIPVIVHSSNPAGAESMYWGLKRAGSTVARVSPYGDLDWIEQVWLAEVKKLLHLPTRATNLDAT